MYVKKNVFLYSKSHYIDTSRKVEPDQKGDQSVLSAAEKGLSHIKTSEQYWTVDIFSGYCCDRCGIDRLVQDRCSHLADDCCECIFYGRAA